MPATPSSALTSPSCIAPSRESVGSSSCSASTPPQRRWYCSAWRSIPALATGLPSSVKPSAPSSRSSAISVSSVAVQAARDRGHEADGDPRVAQRGVAQRPQQRRGVDHRVGVRHRDDEAEAAGRRGARAGLEVLLVLLAGRAQVHVRVDERREQVAARAVDDLRALGRVERAGRADLGDRAAAHQHVGRAVEPGARVEHVRAARTSRSAGLAAGVTMDVAHASDGSGAGSRHVRGRRRAPRRGRPCGRRRPPRPG